MEVTCYVQRGKTKSELLCHAFAQGVRAVGGTAHLQADHSHLGPGAAMFYGVRPQQRHLLEQAKAEGRDWYYVDNAYFDQTREAYFRITRNRLQHSGTGGSDGKRFAALNINVERWRKTGSHILMCPQSDEFLDQFCPEGKAWTVITERALRERTPREIRVRAWQSDKLAWYRTLPDDLRDCRALVTFSSASAITAMLHGVPAFVTAQDSICRPVANLSLNNIERPQYHEDLRPWLNVVADNQFSIAEINSGRAWKMLHPLVDA